MALAIVLLLLPLTVGTALAAKKARAAWVIPETLNVRSGPREDGKKIGSLTRGTKVYVTAFSYPVVPKDSARIRCQVSAAHTPEDLDFALRAFAEAKRELGI